MRLFRVVCSLGDVSVSRRLGKPTARRLRSIESGRMKRIGMVISPVIGGLLLCTAAQAATVKGVVKNGTLDRLEPNVVVQLVYHSAQSAEVLSDTTDASGAFTFEVAGAPSAEVPMMLSAEYDGAQYRSDRVTDQSQSVEILVYEPTDQDNTIQMISHHLIIDASSRQATQILIFQNTGNRTFKTGTGHGHGLEVPLPVGVSEVQSDIPGVHNHGPTLVDSRPVPPGRMQLSFTTPIPADGWFRQTLKYATPSFDAFITPADFQLTENTMTDLGAVSMGERQFRRLLKENVSAGGQVAFRLALPTAPPAAAGDHADPLDTGSKGPWALGGIAVGALLALLYLRMGTKPSGSVSADGELGIEVRRAVLIKQIADLDERFERKAIEESEYDKRRDALKAEVVDLTRDTD